MPVTDEQEEALHAQLAGKLEEHKRLLNALDPVTARTEYSALVSAAFTIAAAERFPEGTPVQDVIEYVGDVRSRTESSAKIAPLIAERLLRAIVTDEKVRDIDPRTSFETQLLLLAALIADAQLDSDGLDRFIRRARRLADRWLA